jgi:hypothetical protein
MRGVIIFIPHPTVVIIGVIKSKKMWWAGRLTLGNGYRKASRVYLKLKERCYL